MEKEKYIPTFTLTELTTKKIKELQNEIREEIIMRRRVYRSQVYQGKKTQKEMDDKINRMIDIGYILKLVDQQNTEAKTGIQTTIDF